MSLLESNLQQISESAQAIGNLSSVFRLFFPPSSKFTNAILGNHDITTLIRDTETHERALFKLHSDGQSGTLRRASRRGTMFPGDIDTSDRLLYPRQQSAVARVLGGDMVKEIERSAVNVRSKQSGGINVEVLLQGAEKLCDVYPIEGATPKIISLRSRYHAVAQSIAQYEARVAQQTEQMGRMNRSHDYSSRYIDDEEDEAEDQIVTEQVLLLEEQEIRELEARKKALEERVSGMEKDLGGLLR
ncbi:hypothetical protein UCRPC4_g06459 [Phaeomoniella chlamydospora]|uniref:DASH complex subunit SPC34 n=1 Tax=Phaeomoniella chlamydospora TaxID=158046 RepID=A0A0G2DY30_PHACM|nr:hypothetical protein UCRPC4_g06459 [Phaeomoniella chlamydospora]